MPKFDGLQILDNAKALVDRMSSHGVFDQVAGIAALQVWNCNALRRDVSVWLYDINAATWSNFGTSKAAYDPASFSCPAPGSPPLLVTMEMKHLYTLVAIEVDGFVCKSDDPTQLGCQHFVWGPNLGDPGGVTLSLWIP